MTTTIYDWQTSKRLAELLNTSSAQVCTCYDRSATYKGYMFERRDAEQGECGRGRKYMYRVAAGASEPVKGPSLWVPASKRLTITEEESPVEALMSEILSLRESEVELLEINAKLHSQLERARKPGIKIGPLTIHGVNDWGIE